MGSLCIDVYEVKALGNSMKMPPPLTTFSEDEQHCHEASLHNGYGPG
jgi:hypothetical protein